MIHYGLSTGTLDTIVTLPCNRKIEKERAGEKRGRQQHADGMKERRWARRDVVGDEEKGREKEGRYSQGW